jgi:hypothetical protein
MCCDRTACRWRVCAGCGRERRLARSGEVLCGHNRWDPATWRMVPCEGSGRPPKVFPVVPGEISLAQIAPMTRSARTVVDRAHG